MMASSLQGCEGYAILVVKSSLLMPVTC